MTVRLNPRKLLLSKWTAVTPQRKEKHFIVTRLVEPDDPDLPVTQVEIEAVHSRRSQVIAWKSLTDTTVWKQGWH
jgi:tryptophan-rich hypothetical protein